MALNNSTSRQSSPVLAVALILGGVVLFAAAWLLPVNLKSINPLILKEAGRNSSSVTDFGLHLLKQERPGPARLALDAAKLLRAPDAPRLASGLSEISTQHPELIPWGSREPYLEAIFKWREPAVPPRSEPVLPIFLSERARSTVRGLLANTRVPGVLALMQTREVTRTASFTPALEPGGQPLDATILLTALLFQGSRFSDSMAKEVQSLAESAIQSKQMGKLEDFYLDMLSLGKRLDLCQLGDLLRQCAEIKTLSQIAQVAQVESEKLPIIYTAALLSRKANGLPNPEGVANYLVKFEKEGLADLTLGLQYGQGALNELISRQVPVNHARSLEHPAVVNFCLMVPRVALALKYLAFFLGGFLVFQGVAFFNAPIGASTMRGTLPKLQTALLALLFTLGVVTVSEPFLMSGLKLGGSQYRVSIATSKSSKQLASQKPTPPKARMQNSTILSIAVFALLQLLVYVVCLKKLRDIERQDIAPTLKLRLTENEENLFDMGLYVGIGGTATALVLQVLGVIDPDLLAAYSSNLFGITCVAMVKIKHVRPYKQKLLMQLDPEGAAAPVLIAAK